MTYLIVKTSIYDHGVMWIGDDLDQAKAKADYFASNHDDGHHDYEVREFNPPNTYGAETDRVRDWCDNCQLIYTGFADWLY